MRPKLLLIFLFFLTVSRLNTQIPPYAFNYSAVARDASGQPISSATIGVQISIIKTSPLGASQYVENHFVNTDAYGLFNLIIGAGAVQSGAMAPIDWSNDNYFLKVGMDVNGGTNFIVMGTTQLLSVPYALHSKTAETLVGGGSSTLSAPSVTTQNATNVTNSSATIFGLVNPNGLLTENIIFEYGLSTAYGSTAANITSNYLTGTSQTQVQANLTNLNSNTLYHYRIKCRNAVDYSTGNDMTFTTGSGAPIINPNLGRDSLNGNSFRFVGSVNPNGSATTVTFEYGSTTSLGSTIACPAPINGGTFIATYSNILNLPYTGTTNIYVRCIATNAFGTTISPIDIVHW